MKGTPIPYLMANDSWVMLLCMLTFAAISIIFILNGRSIFQRCKDQFYYQSTKDSFASHTKLDYVSNSLLLFATSLFYGIIFIYCWQQFNPPFSGKSLITLGYCCLLFPLYFGLKALLYQIVDSAFFTRQEGLAWRNAYFLINRLTGVALLPLIVSILFVGAPFWVNCTYFMLALLISKVLLIKRCYKIFFSKSYGAFGFILYFCALEIIPLLLIGKILLESNHILTVNI